MYLNQNFGSDYDVLKAIFNHNKKYGWKNFNRYGYSGASGKYKYNYATQLGGPSENQTEYITKLTKKLENMKKKGYITVYKITKSKTKGIPPSI